MADLSSSSALPRPSSDWALFLDVDGTLLDIAERPEEVEVPVDLPALLAELQRVFGGALALVSGRTIEDLDRLFQPLSFAAAGEHGAEIRPSPGAPLTVYPPHRPSVALREAIDRVGGAGEGLVVEQKRFGIAVHYRAFPAMRYPARVGLEAVLRESCEPMELLAGKMVWELRSHGSNKGRAVARLMETPAFRDRFPVFVGDDRTDVDGFLEVKRRGGAALPVGVVPMMMDMAFAGPSAVRAWLAALPALVHDASG